MPHSVTPTPSLPDPPPFLPERERSLRALPYSQSAVTLEPFGIPVYWTFVQGLLARDTRPPAPGSLTAVNHSPRSRENEYQMQSRSDGNHDRHPLVAWVEPCAEPSSHGAGVIDPSKILQSGSAKNCNTSPGDYPESRARIGSLSILPSLIPQKKTGPKIACLHSAQRSRRASPPVGPGAIPLPGELDVVLVEDMANPRAA